MSEKWFWELEALLQELEAKGATAQVQQKLPAKLNDCKYKLASLLEHKPKNEASRTKVKSGSVDLEIDGTMQSVSLDEEPDVRLALALSDELHLDEIVCVDLLRLAQEEEQCMTPEMAAGIYFRERKDSLAVLQLLLRITAHAGGIGGIAEEPVRDLKMLDTVEALISGGLFSRLCQLATDKTLLPTDASSLKHVLNDRKCQEGRLDLVMLERTRIWECLFHLAKRFGRSLMRTKDALKTAVDAFTAATTAATTTVPGTTLDEGGRIALSHHAVLCLLVLLALITAEPEGDTRVVAAGVEEAAKDLSITNALRNISPSGYYAVAQLALSMLASAVQDKSRDCETHLSAARDARVFFHLRSGVLESLLFQDDAPRQQELYTEVLLSVLLRILEPRYPGSLVVRQMIRDAAGDDEDSNGNGGDYGAVVPPSPPMQPGQIRDGVADVLRFVAVALTYLPVDKKIETLEGLGFGEAPGSSFGARDMFGQRAADECTATPEVFVALMRILESVAREDGVHGVLSPMGSRTTAVASGGNFGGQYRPAAGIGAHRVADLLTRPLGRVGACWHWLFTILSQVLDRVQRHRMEVGPPIAPEDLVGLEAILDVLTAVLKGLQQSGEGMRKINRLSDLCREMTRSDAASLLQQLLNFPLPQLTRFRAAVLRCLTAFMTDPSSAYNLLQSLAEPNARLGMSQAPLLRAEQFQLTEAEAREGAYPESIAFLGLINRIFELVLLPSRGAEPTTYWASTAIQASALALPYTVYVREVILGQLAQRDCRDLRDKWRLAELGAYHLELSIEALLQAAAILRRDALTGPSPAPGVSVLLDMLGGGPGLKCLLTLLEVGLVPLMEARQNSAPGVNLEAALVAALRTIAKALDCDRQFVDLYSRLQLQSIVGASLMEPEPARTLDRVLMAEPRRLATLMQFVRYPFHSDVQEYTIRIAGQLAARSPRLLEVLGAGSNTLDDLVDGFASALRESIFTPRVRDPSPFNPYDADMEEEMAAEPLHDADSRASLILRLLLSTVGQPAPNLAHVLLGYGMEVGVSPAADGSRYFSCLDVVMEFLLSPNAGTATSKPDLYEQCLELLYRLASQPATAATTIGLLQERNCGLLLALVQPLLGSGRPVPLPPASDPSRTACLRQRAWLVRVLSLALLNSLLLPEAAKVVRALLLPRRDEADTADSLASSVMGLVSLVEAPEEPLLDHSIKSEASRSLISRLRLEGVLTGALTSEETRALVEAGVLLDSSRGYNLIDGASLRRESIRQAEAIPGASGPQLDTMLNEALAHVERYNAYVEDLAAQELLVTAVQELIEVVFARRLPLMLQQLREVAPSKTVEQLLSSIVRTLLYKAQSLLKGPSIKARDILAPPLCYAVAGVMGRLQASASTAVLPVALPDVSVGTEGDLTPRLAPSDCAELLRLMVEGVLAADRSERARLPLYLSIFSYLMYARPSKVSGDGLQAILEGRGKDPQATDGVAKVDAVQGRLDEATSRVLSDHGAALTSRMAQDAVEVQWPEMYRALCLRLMGALVAMDPRGAFAKEVAQSALPRTLLSSLGGQTTALLQQSPIEAQRTLGAVEAALGLLLDLVQCSSRDDAREMARRLYDLRALQYLTAIKALGVPPEEPGQGHGLPSPTLRERINRVLTPVLRLATLMVTMLAESDRVVQEAVNFIETHSRPLVRILREVGESRGVVGWEQGEAELEQAQLIVQLFSRLPPGESLAQRLPQLHYAALALAQEFVNKNGESSNRYLAALALSPDAGAHAAARGRGTVSTPGPGLFPPSTSGGASASVSPLSSRRGTAYERLSQRVLSLRCALVQFVRQAVLADRLQLPCATDLKSPDALPSLMQLLALIEQTVSDLDLGLKDRVALVNDLKSTDDQRLQTVLAANGVPKDTVARLGPDSRRRLAERVLGRLERHTTRAARQQLYLLENALAVLHFHVDFAVRAAGQRATVSGLPLAGGQGAATAHLVAHAAAALATDPATLESLRKRTLTVLGKLQQTSRHQSQGADVLGLGDLRPEEVFTSVEGLVRRVKDSLTVLVGGFGL